MKTVLALAATLCWADPVLASEVEGTQLSVAWGLPFAGILLSAIAIAYTDKIMSGIAERRH